MSVDEVLSRGRAAAEALMVDAVTIRRQTGSTTDPDTGIITPTYTTIYQGKCKVQQSPAGSQSREETPGQAELLMVRRELHLPVATSLDVRADDVATIDTCVHDPDLVGCHLVIRSEMAKSMATARRLGVEEVTG